MSPAVSVILNCYNHEPYVAEAIESVLAQTFRDFELIIIDNGSTDGTRAVIERYDDPRIRLALHDENLSLSRRLNEGAAMARGEFVAVLYSDDYMLPDKLERQVALFATLPEDHGIVYCPALGFNQWTGKTWQHPSMGISGKMMPAILRSHFRGGIDMASPLTRRECFQQFAWYDDLFTDGEGIFFRIALRWRFHFDLQPTVVLRDHGANLSKGVQRNHDLLMRMLDRLEREPGFPLACRGDLNRFRAAACRNNAWTVLRGDGDASWARSQLLKLITVAPSQVLHGRTLAAIALATVPSPARSALNKFGHLVRSRPENRVVLPS